MRGASLLVLAGCNQLFDIGETKLLDASVDRLIEPTPPHACPTELPAFAQWSYAPIAFPGYPYTDNSIQAAAFYGDGRAYVGDGLHVFDADAQRNVVPIVELQPPANEQVPSFATDPRGAVIWFARGGVVGPSGMETYLSTQFYAVRDQGWATFDANLPLAGPPYIAWPRSVAFYQRTIRMTLSVLDQPNSKFHMVELSSDDGYKWDDAHTLDVFGEASGPYLSPDGCVLLFTRSDPVALPANYPKLFAALRDDATGGFGTEIRIGGPPDAALYSETPSVDLDHGRLWYSHTFVDNPCCDRSMIEGHP